MTNPIRRSYSGSAVGTTAPGIIQITDTVITIATSATTLNFPDTTIGPFIITVNRDLADEEKVLIGSYTGTTLNVFSGGRGADGTTAIAHEANATIEHTLDALTLQEAHDFCALVGTVSPATLAMSSVTSKGTSSVAAAADHVHAMPGYATGVTSDSAPGDSVNDGSSAHPAHADHVHGREAAPPDTLGLPLALTGATAATRYAGGTASGAPASGTFAVGDFVIDQTGVLWVCTTAGSPGTWTKIGPLTGSAAVAGTPAGRMKTTAQTVLGTGVAGQITSFASDYVKGGVTFGSNGLTVPTTGIYQINASVFWQSSGSPVPGGQYSLWVYKNGSSVRLWEGSPDHATSQFTGMQGSDQLSLAASDVLTMHAAQGSGETAGTTSSDPDTALSVGMISN